MFKNLMGNIKFEAIVPDTNNFINILKESYISIEGLQYQKGKIIGKIGKNDFKELKRIGVICNAQISIIDEKGFFFILEKYKGRAGLVLGALIAILIINFFADIVMIIEVYGNESVSDNYILSLANDTGIHIGAHISEIDLRKAERIMVSSSDKISWVGIRSAGSKIQIEVNEMDIAPEVLDKTIPCNIVSTKDAQIVEIKNVYSGMLVQMLNNGVKKGELLISGTVDDGKGGVFYTHSIGEIIGRYNETVVFTQPYKDEIINYEDKVIKKSIHFLGLRMPIIFRKPENYELSEEVTYLEVLGIRLPIGMIYTEYKSYNIQNIEYTDEQIKDILANKVKQYELNFLKNKGMKIIDKEIEYMTINNEVKATIKYTIEGNIGKSKEIIVK